jgi:SAM-dependent methyltransferase
VLDIGSGPGREVAYLNRAGYEAVGLDNSEEMLSWAKEHYPGLPFVYGDQSDFSLQQQFDALYCVGSTFLYNFKNEDVLASLQCFRKHLHTGGLLYLDMRNAAFFLTKEGHRWLTEELVEQRKVNDTVISLQTRFSIDLATQILERDYCWTVTGYKPIVEHLKHRLLFPQELMHYLTTSGFRLLRLFDKPAPHVDTFDQDRPLSFSNDLLGTRMQVIAQAV